jgi:hypothetical protein
VVQSGCNVTPIRSTFSLTAAATRLILVCGLPLPRCCLYGLCLLTVTRHQHNRMLVILRRSNAMSEELVRRLVSAVAGTVTNRLFADYCTFLYDSLFLHSLIRPAFATDLISLSARLASILLDVLCMSAPRMSELSCSVTNRLGVSISGGRGLARQSVWLQAR